MLNRGGFREVTKNVIPTTEDYGTERTLAYLQSVSLWNLVPAIHKQRAIEVLRTFCDKEVLQHGKLERQLEIVVVMGRS